MTFPQREVAVCAALLCSLSGAVMAQTPQATLSEVRVDASAETESATGPVVGYRARNASTATKTDTPLSETP